MTKLRVEEPLLRGLRSVEAAVAKDTARNRLVLHRQVHQHFESRAPTASWKLLTGWLYETLFLMPLHDEWLGPVSMTAGRRLKMAGWER